MNSSFNYGWWVLFFYSKKKWKID